MIYSSKPRMFTRSCQARSWKEVRHSPRTDHGLTLVEVIGTLSIIAILGAIATPVIQQQARQAEQQAEAITMSSIAQALEKTIVERKTLPGTNDWVDWIAVELDQPLTRLASTGSGCPRRLLYHPGSALTPGGVGRTQTASGFENLSPGADRILVVSTLERTFPDEVDLGSEAMFEALWNRRPQEAPAGWPEGALADPHDLQIVRLDLGQLLHQVVINNISEGNTAASISVEENATTLSIPRENPGRPWQRSFIHGTGLNLHGFMGSVRSRELINEDRTLYWSDAGWGALAAPPGSAWTSALITVITDFLNASFPDAKNEQRPRAALDELYRSLWTYMDWANAGFLEGGNNKKEAPDAYVVRSTVARLNQGTLNLIGSGGGGK